MAAGKTIYEKIWDLHVIEAYEDSSCLLHIDRCYAHDLGGPFAFRMMEKQGYEPLNRSLITIIPDHTLSSKPGRTADSSPISKSFYKNVLEYSRKFNVRMFELSDPRQGVVHTVGPETGLSLPGLTIVCGDSHTCTHGALGALAWGIGTSELYHAITTQTIVVKKPKLMRIRIGGTAHPSAEPMDVILSIISKYGAGFGAGYAIEFDGNAIRQMNMEDRMTICNLAVELGSEYAIIAPDETTFDYIKNREFSPKGEMFDAMVAHAKKLVTDADAEFDIDISVDITGLKPQISWGISPEHTIEIDGVVPSPSDSEVDSGKRNALGYMDFKPGQKMLGVPVQRVFIGSCSNGRISNLARAAKVVDGKHVADGVEAWVVPGSQTVKREAESMGLDRIFKDAGFMWGEPGCSLCGGCNGERVMPGDRCVSTTNRNFMGRQGPGSRTHLASPTTAALAAINGRIIDTSEAVQ